jgi:hypothetical protein
MNHAIKLMRYNNFHRNIKEIGATGESFCHHSFTSPLSLRTFIINIKHQITNVTTGGGAHKFADDWKKGLGINMAKQDEMDSLVT